MSISAWHMTDGYKINQNLIKKGGGRKDQVAKGDKDVLAECLRKGMTLSQSTKNSGMSTFTARQYAKSVPELWIMVEQNRIGGGRRAV